MFRKLLSRFLPASSPQKPGPNPIPATLEINSPESHNLAYRQAAALVAPYFQLHDRPRKPANTADAQRELHRGISILKAVTDYNPHNWNAHWIAGKAHQALGDHQSAYPCFKSAFEIQRHNPDVAREFMFTCLHLGYAEEGVAAAVHAVTLDPSQAGLLANLALAY